MKLTQKDYDIIFKGFFLTDCVVRKKDKLYFILQQELSEDATSEEKRATETRVVTCFDDPDPEEVWGYSSLKGMQTLKAGVSYHPKEQFVGVSLNDHVFILGGGVEELEKDLVGGRHATGKDIGMRGGVKKLRPIDGWLWLAGFGRTLGKRTGKDQWEWQDDIPYRSLMDDGGFNDIDGFSGKDIYAAGGHGDVWHFDGERWKQLPFPSNMTLEALCCAGDGYVYIGAEQGTVFKGRGDQWEMIYRGNMALPYRDMVWYEGQVWCASDYGIWTITNGKLEEADVPASVAGCSGHLSAGDGVLLLAGIYGAALYDGKAWQPIIDYSNL